MKLNRISVRFGLRPPKKGKPHGNPHPLQVWVSINGKRVKFGAVWQNGPLRVNPQEWRADKQATARRRDSLNQSLAELKDRLEDIHYEQKRGGAQPTVDSVVFEFRYNVRPTWNKTAWAYPVLQQSRQGIIYAATATSPLDMAYKAYLRHLKASAAELSPITIGRWERGLFLLEQYVQQSKQPLPDVNAVTIGWAKRYHAWLQTQSGGRHRAIPVGAGQASRFVLKLAKVLDWLMEEEVIDTNPIRRIRWPKPADKPVQFLQPEQLAHLLTLRWPATKGVGLWWFNLMCCTGLDYPDAIAYAKNRAAFEVQTPGGKKIVGRRNKPPHNEYHLPLLPEVDTLFAQYPLGPADISAQCVNRITGFIEQELGISWRITAKTARKTFGCLMLSAGIRIADVSLMLGHASIATSERYYVKVRGESIDRLMTQQQLSVQQTINPNQPIV